MFGVESLGKDVNSVVDFSLPLCSQGAWVTLIENVEKTIVTPPGFNRVFFSFAVGTNVFFAYGSTPIDFPPPADFEASLIEINPGVRQIDIEGGQTLRFVSNTNSYVTLYFALGQ